MPSNAGRVDYPRRRRRSTTAPSTTNQRRVPAQAGHVVVMAGHVSTNQRWVPVRQGRVTIVTAMVALPVIIWRRLEQSPSYRARLVTSWWRHNPIWLPCGKVRTAPSWHVLQHRTVVKRTRWPSINCSLQYTWWSLLPMRASYSVLSTYCFHRCLSVCLCVCLSAQKKLKNYCSEIDVTW